MRVLGIDPGSRALGYGVVESDGSRFRHVASGVIRSSASTPRPARLHHILQSMRQILGAHEVGAVAVEDAFFGAGPRSCLRLGEARGVVIAVSAEGGLTVAEYPPATVKKALTGAGGASKDLVGRSVRAVLSMAAGRKTVADETDALAVALCHLLRVDGDGREALLARVGRRRTRSRPATRGGSYGGHRSRGRAAPRRIRARVTVDARKGRGAGR